MTFVTCDELSGHRSCNRIASVCNKRGGWVQQGVVRSDEREEKDNAPQLQRRAQGQGQAPYQHKMCAFSLQGAFTFSGDFSIFFNGCSFFSFFSVITVWLLCGASMVWPYLFIGIFSIWGLSNPSLFPHSLPPFFWFRISLCSLGCPIITHFLIQISESKMFYTGYWPAYKSLD